ncbi:MAG: hypothetical protein KBA26_02380 [Candidatus Delongbacteria bacterium]|nr:hypothetical protein [Candidatus Delongbacteria bacterium]
MSKKKTSKKRNWQKELRRLNRLFKHLKSEKDSNPPVHEPRSDTKPSLRDSFKNIYSSIRSYSSTRDHQMFRELVNLDLTYLAGLPFAIYPDIKSILLPQSVTGHALYGHSRFCDSSGKSLVFADASIEKVVACINPDRLPEACRNIAQAREDLLMDFFSVLKEHLGDSSMKLIDRNGRGLLGFKFFEQVEVEIDSFVKGFFLGAMMDNLSYRKLANQIHAIDMHGAPFVMGGGEIYLVDEDHFKATGLRTRDLTDKTITPSDIQKMREYGIIIDEAKAREGHTLGLYFRLKEGSGVCDDAALIYIGRRFGIDAFWGAFAADACDTYDKYVTHYKPNGYDEYFANWLNHYWMETHHEPIVGNDDVVDIIYMSAEDNYPKISFSSSHRRLVQYEDNSGIPTIINHLNFINHTPVSIIPLGFERFPSNEFYSILDTRADIIKLPYW